MNLDGTSFQVGSTAEDGVVSRDTRLDFVQRGSKVLGRYYGGSIRRGYLVGRLTGRILRVRYAQTEATGQVHGGTSQPAHEADVATESDAPVVRG